MMIDLEGGFCGGGGEAFKFFSVPVDAGVLFFRQEGRVPGRIKPVKGAGYSFKAM
jgi:hypothetical protein